MNFQAFRLIAILALIAIGTSVLVNGEALQTERNAFPAQQNRLRSRRLLESGVQPTAVACPKGYYRQIGHGVKLDECILCPLGVYGSSTGLTSPDCTAPCPKGTYNDRLGATSAADCSPCPAGTYGSKVGLQSSACTAPCERGTYSIEEGLTKQSECLKCPPNYRGQNGLRGSNLPTVLNPTGNNNGGYRCDVFWKGDQQAVGRDLYEDSLAYADV